MRKLSDIIIERIRESGPISVAEYMELCLAHPEFGYYMGRDPFGIAGDFTTAPEVSQMFGEMIGLWVADMWQKLGSPSPFILCECGPGRGTLMRDMLRAFDIVPGLKDAVQIHLVETSPFLKEKQKEILPENIIWHDSLATLPDNVPLVLIGNEFIDALPIEQASYGKGGWHKRLIDEKFEFVLGEKLDNRYFPFGQMNDIYEYSPIRDAVWKDICKRIQSQKGAALIIDYGFVIDSVGETLQAVKNHQYVSVFETPGDSDITSHVNFWRLKELAEGLAIAGPGMQGNFLKSLGIETRAQMLAEYNPDKKEQIYTCLQRLIDDDKMGSFKVMYVSDTQAV